MLKGLSHPANMRSDRETVPKAPETRKRVLRYFIPD